MGNLTDLSKRASVPFVKPLSYFNAYPAPFFQSTPNKNSPKEDRNYIVEILLDAARESTTHGIDHMFKRTNRFIQIMWLLSFLASTSVCAYYISQSITDYLSFDTVTKAEQVYVVSTQFPAVSICNVNPFLTNASYEFVQNLLIKNGLISPSDPTNGFNYYFDDTLVSFKFLSGFNALDPNLTDDFRKRFGYEMKDMLLSCVYNLNNCSADDFYWYFDMQFGNCYIFNSGIIRIFKNSILKKFKKGLFLSKGNMRTDQMRLY